MFRHGLVFIVLSLAPSFVSAQPHFSFFEPVVPPRPIQVMVHRGLAVAAPENSAAAIEMCAEDFIEWAEIDVRLTKDGRHVIIHDDTVNATTNGKGRVSDLTIDELKKLDAGSWFAARFAGNRLMTLPEALAVAKGKVNLCLDCKRIDPKLLVKEVMAARMERQVIVYGSSAALVEVKAASMGTVAGMTNIDRPWTSMHLSRVWRRLRRTLMPRTSPPNCAGASMRPGLEVRANVLGDALGQPQRVEACHRRRGRLASNR